MLFTQWSEALPGFKPELDLASLAHQERVALVDCNQFYVSCERLFRPELRGVPVVVLSNNDGCVIARSQEARDMGIEMGVPWFEVRQRYGARLPISFSSNYTLYEAVSERVMASLRSLGYPLEVYSIDEGFVQLPLSASAALQAQLLEERVHRWTGIPVGVGIGSTKSLAKVATWLAKRRYRQAWYVLEDLTELELVPIDALWGVGSRHTERLKAINVLTAADFIKADPVWIRKNMTVQGLRLYLELQGISYYPLQTTGRRRKQIRHSRTLARDETCFRKLRAWLSGFVVQAAQKLRSQDCVAGKLSVLLMSNRFRQTGQSDLSVQCFKSLKLERASNFTPALLNAAGQLLKELYRAGVGYKKLGVLLQDLTPRQEITMNWLNPSPDRDLTLMQTIDTLNQSMGYQAVSYASQLGGGAYSRQLNRSPRYLTRWEDLPGVPGKANKNSLVYQEAI